ncbi:MAG: hypothetical protein AW07_03714 [Candidatus Accumulibacter sp. SK-11]|nr:MAG: hypothetical protein AW07_03714 [Candidatus Accumulibacter sp. SK-11]
MAGAAAGSPALAVTVEPQSASLLLRYHVASQITTETRMAGLDASTRIPIEIRLHQRSRVLEVSFEDGESFQLSYEFLRVFTPSAEARGHGPGQEVLQVGKRNVDIERVESVGNYAIRPIFSDGHDSGLYSWDLLYNLGRNQQQLWQAYLDRLQLAGGSRDAPEPPPLAAKAQGGCNKH